MTDSITEVKCEFVLSPGTEPDFLPLRHPPAQPSRMNLLLRAHSLEGLDSALGIRALGMVEATLTAMAKGGIYDHIFDGFARFDSDVEDFSVTCLGGEGRGVRGC